ncbi:MAG TPA: carboxypeptidase-like regulatory domain-containing protein [Terracidiphilus sp.]|jgi:hypothetical protein|nr:carboxypeptidase-like regulatory domain-containing protein [Terracidiphilus sp.]
MHLLPRFSPASVLALACILTAGEIGWCQDASNSKWPAAEPRQSGTTTANGAEAYVPDAPEPTAKDASETGVLSGTVTDSYGDIVPGATVAVDDGIPSDRRTTGAGDNGQFQFGGLAPGNAYRVTVSAPGFVSWTSSKVSIAAGHYQEVTGIRLALAKAVSSVTVFSSTEQIATQQVHIEEQQRVLGFIPNFYVVYDAKNAVPMTTKLKFEMAVRVSIDPITFLGTGFLAGINQAADTPDYPEGAKGYGERFGAVYTDGLTDTMFGGAILPSLLHQDPRYFYQGTGSIRSRILHALANPFVCRGDDGERQPNYSSIGGDLIASSLSNLYYPARDRGAAFVFEGVASSTAQRAVSSIFQEFVVRKFTPRAKRQN